MHDDRRPDAGTSDDGTAAEARRVVADRLAATDVDALVAAIERSRDLLAPWVDPSADPAHWHGRIDDVRAVTFVLRHREGLVGVVTASEIVRGAFRSCYLGYYALAPLAGRGLFRVGMRAALDRVFADEAAGGLGLHRAEANIQPGNERSIRLVRALGFRREGFSPRYLHIDGAWRDHERWALLVDDPREG